MTPDQYAPCPCGSGKKFKWCCLPIYGDIQRVFEQFQNGQHDSAQRLMEEVVRKHPTNPEVWGRQAHLLHLLGKTEQAEEALQRAFELNANYPFGLWLRAIFRYAEGEVPGALILSRKAADAYDPQARGHLAETYRMIFELEMGRNRPVAARAALQLVRHFEPADDNVRQAFDSLFGEESRLPRAARREYRFRSPAKDLPGSRRAAWDRALSASGSPRLSAAARAFEALTQEDAGDAAAWYNLALCRAWLGDNAAALEALDRYLAAEADDSAAAEAATLAEVLRCGEGLEDQCDYHEYATIYQIRDFPAVQNYLQELHDTQRFIPARAGSEEGVLVGLVLEGSGGGLITSANPALPGGARLAGYLAVRGSMMRISGSVKDRYDKLREEIRQRLPLNVEPAQEERRAIPFQEVVSEALYVPVGKGAEQSQEEILAQVGRYYEEKWIHQPRRSLEGNTPLDAVGHPRLRRKLQGVIRFIEECAATGALEGYSFDRLRRKLGLAAGAAAPAPAAPAGSPAPGPDIAAMGAGELAALDAQGLTDEQLEQAFQASNRLDAPELSSHFARSIVARPPRPERPDRYLWFAHLTDRALREGDTAEALDRINEGLKDDCEHNQGRRRNDYELRRGKVVARSGDAPQARDVFQGLIQRAPDELAYRTQAAETMLSQNQPAFALQFAEGGLELARRQQNRDGEQHLLELVAAAKKRLG